MIAGGDGVGWEAALASGAGCSIALRITEHRRGFRTTGFRQRTLKRDNAGDERGRTQGEIGALNAGCNGEELENWVVVGNTSCARACSAKNAVSADAMALKKTLSLQPELRECN